MKENNENKVDTRTEIYNFIKTEPRKRSEVVDFAKDYLYVTSRTVYNILKGFEKGGKVRYVKCGRKKIYSVIDDPRLEYIASKIEVFDSNGHRLDKINQYWNEFEMEDVIDDYSEITAKIKSFSSNTYYIAMIRDNGEFSCTCHGFLYHEVPCVHILALAINTNKIDWLP